MLAWCMHDSDCCCLQMPPTKVVAAIVARVNTLESAMQDIWLMLTVPSDSSGGQPPVVPLQEKLASDQRQTEQALSQYEFNHYVHSTTQNKFLNETTGIHLRFCCAHSPINMHFGRVQIQTGAPGEGAAARLSRTEMRGGGEGSGGRECSDGKAVGAEQPDAGYAAAVECLGTVKSFNPSRVSATIVCAT